MPTVTLYAKTGCRYCDQARSFLTDHGIEFTEHDIGSDDERAREMVQRTGQRGVPVITVDGGETTDQIIGYDEDRLEDTLL